MQSLIQAMVSTILNAGQVSSLLAQNQVYMGEAPETALMPFLTLGAEPGGPTRHDFSKDRLTQTTVVLTAVGPSLPVLLEIADQLGALLDAASFPLATGVLLGVWQAQPPEPTLAGFDAANDEVYRVKTRFRCEVFETAQRA